MVVFKEFGPWNIFIAEKQSVVCYTTKFSWNAMQPAVAVIAYLPNQPYVDIENTGKFGDDVLSVL